MAIYVAKLVAASAIFMKANNILMSVRQEMPRSREAIMDVLSRAYASINPEAIHRVKRVGGDEESSTLLRDFAHFSVA